MKRRIVDVFLHDNLVGSYLIVIDDERQSLSSLDYIAGLKPRLRQQDPGFEVSRARIIVRPMEET
jgi:hypothetical protein